MINIKDFVPLLETVDNVCKLRNKYYLANIGKPSGTVIQLIHPLIMYKDGLISINRDKSFSRFGYGILIAQDKLIELDITLAEFKKLNCFSFFEELTDSNGIIRLFANCKKDKGIASLILAELLHKLFKFNLNDEIIINLGYWKKDTRIFV